MGLSLGLDLFAVRLGRLVSGAGLILAIEFIVVDDGHELALVVDLCPGIGALG